uniref:Arrestin-like N-terminal domain-containing protein n=1 Tax=Heliothis virescens TaxID=7102 RepID=A0A2A4JQ68_HELVI
MAVPTDILIQIPKYRKKITTEPINGLVKYHLGDETVNKKIGLTLERTKNSSWYQFDFNYPLQQPHKGVGHHNVDKIEKYEDRKTYVLLKIKMVNKNFNDNDETSTDEPENEIQSIQDEGITRYHVEIKFTKPATVFSLKKEIKTRIKVYPTVESPFPNDPFMSALDQTLMKLFSNKKHEINLQIEIEKACCARSRVFNVAFVVANNSDVTISLKTVNK